jgi:hypothetical protein
MDSLSVISQKTINEAGEAKSREHRGTRIAVSAALILGGFGISGCAAHSSQSTSAETATAKPSATSVEATQLNNLSGEEISTWGSQCGLNNDLIGEIEKVPQGHIDYLRKAFADRAMQESPGYRKSVCEGLVTTLGDLLVQTK